MVTEITAKQHWGHFYGTTCILCSLVISVLYPVGRGKS